MQMTPNYSYLFPRPLFPPQSRSFSLWSTKSLNGCHPTSFDRLNPSKTEFIIIGLSAQIKKIPNPSIHLSDNSSSTIFTSDAPVRNPGVTFDPRLSFSNHISNLSRSCFMLSAILLLLLIFNFLSPTTSPTYPAPASCTSVTSVASDPCLTLKLPPPLPPPSSILQLPLPQSRLHPNTASPAHPKFFCTGCY